MKRTTWIWLALVGLALVFTGHPLRLTALDPHVPLLPPTGATTEQALLAGVSLISVLTLLACALFPKPIMRGVTAGAVK